VTTLSDHDPGSLRDAIASTPAGGTVDFQPGFQGTITLTTGELQIAQNLTITGPGAGALTVSGNNVNRVFDVVGAFTVNLSGLTVANGLASMGGGLFVSSGGTFALTACTFTGNAAGYGAGILNEGSLTVTGCTFTGNHAANSTVTQSNGGALAAVNGVTAVLNSNFGGNIADTDGGGLRNDGGQMTVSNCTFTGNHANYGGGVYNGGWLASGGTLTMTGCTFVGNSVAGGGGGFSNDRQGVATVVNSTFTGNSGRLGGGVFNGSIGQSLTLANVTVSGNGPGSGLYVESAGDAVVLHNSLIAGNAPDVTGGVNGASNNNLIGNGTGLSGISDGVHGNRVGTAATPIDPQLGPLQDNGGPTFTMALLPGSPAIDAGDNAFAPGPYDQRGPGFPRIVNGIIDIGAFEVQAALTVQCSVTTPVLWPPNNQLVNVGLSVQVSDPSAAVTVQVFADDGALSSDAADLAPGQLRLRSDRQGGGSGRVYLIVVTATDAAGDVASSVCTVVVPHDHSAGALAAVEQQAADAEAYFLAFHTAPPGYRPLG
jgi:hypothetical protein